MIDEKDLLKRLKDGDSNALEIIFDMYSDKIYRLAIGILHDEQQADGVVQDTFLKLITSFESFEGRSSISTWLYRVAYNESLKRIERSKRNISLDVALDNDFMPSNFAPWDEVPDTAFNSREAIEQMQRAIDDLPPLLKVVFTLRDVEGLSTAETASIVNITKSAVKVRLHRARLLLREQLANYFKEYSAL